MVCCQGLIGGREKRISGHWDLNPGLESGPKSALPLNLYFPDHSSIPQEKIIYFFFAITSFLTLAAQQPTSFQNFWGWLFPFLASFSTIPFSCQLHFTRLTSFHNYSLLSPASPEQQQEHRNRISLCSFREQQHQQIVMLHAFLHTSPPSRKNALPPPPHPPETYKWAEEATKPEEEATRPEGGLHQQPSTNTYFFGNSKQLPPVSK